MRILIFANNVGGLVSFRRELLEALRKNNEEVFCCVPAGDAIEAVKALGCRFVPIEMDRHGTNPFQELKLLSSYRKILKAIKPDIVFTYTIKCNAYGGMACSMMKIPYVANITGLGTAIENGGIMQKVSLFLYKAGLRKAQKVFFQNTENRDFMLAHGAVRGAYDMLPGSGVNLDKYTVCPYPAGETVDFIFVARIMKEKGIDQYLEAAKYITEKYPQTRFHICGTCEPEYAGNLEELHEKGVVIYHGAVSDMEKIYAMASCTVHPTYYPEGMSNVLLESCACGRPIITTDRSGCREIVDNGVNGFIVRQRDSQDLIEKIEKFLALSWDDRRIMGLAGRAKVEKEFSRAIVVERYMEEVQRIYEKTYQ